MSYDFEKLLEERRIIKGKITQEMIAKELKSAEYDLNKAKLSYEEGDFKWAIVQAYYAMFHGIRALVYSKGYREKSHYALKIAFKELFVDAGILEGNITDTSRMRWTSGRVLITSRSTAREEQMKQLKMQENC
jgi:uncharacterized protein (UPF0332 family)